MALHFTESEFSARRARLMARMAEEKLDALLLFAQESMYWLTCARPSTHRRSRTSSSGSTV